MGLGIMPESVGRHRCTEGVMAVTGQLYNRSTGHVVPMHLSCGMQSAPCRLQAMDSGGD